MIQYFISLFVCFCSENIPVCFVSFRLLFLVLQTDTVLLCTDIVLGTVEGIKKNKICSLSLGNNTFCERYFSHSGKECSVKKIMGGKKNIKVFHICTQQGKILRKFG